MSDPVGQDLRRAVDLRRFGNGLTRRVVTILEAARDDITAQLVRLDPTAVGTGYRERRLRALLVQIEETLATAYGDVRRVTRRELVGLAEVTLEQTAADLRRLVGTEAVVRTVAIGPDRLRAIVDTSPVQGWVMGDWWAEQRRQTGARFERQMRIGLTQSETIDQLVVRVRGRSVGRGRYVGGVMDVSTRGAETLVRTAANQVASASQQLTLERNADVAPRYQYRATLDARTTPICQALDGQTFRVNDEAAPRPPLHWECRSRMLPVVDWKALGIEPPEPGMRASRDGPVSAEVTYSDWLRDQPQSVQDEILGPNRASLFRNGKASLRDMVAQEGRTRTLEELRARI